MHRKEKVFLHASPSKEFQMIVKKGVSDENFNVVHPQACYYFHTSTPFSQIRDKANKN